MYNNCKMKIEEYAMKQASMKTVEASMKTVKASMKTVKASVKVVKTVKTVKAVKTIKVVKAFKAVKPVLKASVKTIQLVKAVKAVKAVEAVSLWQSNDQHEWIDILKKTQHDWYYDTLPELIVKNQSINKEEHIALVEWKLKQGTHRPILLKYAKELSNDAIIAESKATFENKQDPHKAIRAYSKLKGVGYATASAFASACNSNYPYMSDALLATLGISKPFKYNRKEYEVCLSETQKKAGALNGTLTPREIERCIAYVSKKQNMGTIVKNEDNEPRLTIVSWNINGIRAINKKNAIGEGLDLDTIDVLCLQEIRCDENVAKQLISKTCNDKFPYIEFNVSTDKKGYAGTAILSKFPMKNVSFDLPELPKNKEGRVITAMINGITIVTVYTPNAGASLDRLEYRTQTWDIEFKKYITSLSGKKVIVCGDLNVAHKEIDLFHPTKNTKTAGFTIEERTSFESIIQDTKMIDSFRHMNPTAKKFSFWSNFANSRERGIGWRIDYMLTSKSVKINHADIWDQVKGSDHAPIVLIAT